RPRQEPGRGAARDRRADRQAEGPPREPGPVAAARPARRRGRGGRDRLAQPVGGSHAPFGGGAGTLDLGRRRLRGLSPLNPITKEAAPRKERGLFFSGAPRPANVSPRAGS